MSDIKVTLLDSRDEFLPGRSGGPVNAPLLISGIVLVLLGIASVLNPETFLAGLSYAAGVGFLFVGAVMLVSYLRVRGTLQEKGGISLFTTIAVLVFGIVLCAHPLIGVTIAAWIVGLGLVVFGLVQMFVGVQLRSFGGIMCVVELASGVFEIVLGGAMCIWPGSLGLIIGLVGIVYGVSLIAFSLPIGIDHTNRLW